jgi:hypothetical protein
MTRVFIYAALLFVASCHVGGTGGTPRVAGSPAPDASSSPPDAQKTAFAPDAGYFQFGSVFEVEARRPLDVTNPHQVAGHSVFLCRSGATETLLRDLGPAEGDAKLRAAFVTFVREFGPDLEAFKDSPLALKFEGYRDGRDESIWYYYLVSPEGKNLPRRPWVSLRRSKRDGRCALTGIFLNAEGDEQADMPAGLKRS